jgi:hypothetical protein
MSAVAMTAVIRIVAAGMELRALLHPDAPLTAAAFCKLLPLRKKLIHVRWSGEACWIPLGDCQLGVGFENHTSYPSAGDVLFYAGGYGETELLTACDACCFASRIDPLAGNHFRTIVDGRDRLRDLGAHVLWEGAQEVLVELDGSPRSPR